MFLRSWFKNSAILGRPPSRWIRSENSWMKARRLENEARRLAEAELEVQKRMANSLGETYDTSQRMPQTAKESYDFSQ